ncbi:MAG: hypothetical protein A3B37_01490 [Candidatus Sungbacteria bacterium RIFCSPLOWO2_01_FULL_59_16]|uniref:Uncharacterized protein n=1 Tax=Candidatus Sungbacteria bacterium RIFCSPLOWO2_01_FULL_59_16 TaxID=1802280 RepID=A0A1G2LC34_9BACT|nr:MAG: hypothetical protein A3B37_01490 [Candidatus Sungbacteria bacterium RIFCSPLOWO2_01_FULL_59_16]
MTARRLTAPFPVSLSFALIALVLLVALPASAQIVPPECRADRAAKDCTICHIGILVINLTRFLMETIAFPVAALLIAAGGIMLLISGPSEQRRTQGKKILTSTVVGILIVLLAWLAVDTTIKIVTGKLDFSGPGQLLESWGPWNTFNPTPCPL